MFVFYLVFCCFCQTEGAIRNLIFERTPSTASLTGLGCALEEYDKLHARGVKYDSESGTCEALPESWFTSPTFENKTYHKLLMEERIFQAGPTIVSEMPSDFTTSGSSVVLNVYLGNIASDDFYINMEGKDSGIICYHLNVRFYSNEIVFNSNIGGWGVHVYIPTNGRFATSYTTYRLELKLTAAAIEACLMLSLESVYPLAHQLALDMLTRLSTANEEVIEVLLSKHQLLPAVRFIRKAGITDTVSPRKYLKAAMHTDDSQLFFTVFKFFEQINIRMRGSPIFQPGEHCEMYVKHFEHLFGTDTLAAAS